jgi:hypothetical protein
MLRADVLQATPSASKCMGNVVNFLDQRYLLWLSMLVPALHPRPCLDLLPKLLALSEEIHMARSVVSANDKNTTTTSYYPPLADIVVEAPNLP